MTRCTVSDDRISLFVDGALEADEAAALQDHLTSCARCHGLAADVRRLRQAAADVGPVAPPAALRGRIADRLAQEGRLRVTGRSPHAGGGWLRRAAVIATAAGLASLLYLAGTRPDPPPQTAAHPLDAATAELDLALHHYERAVAELELAAASLDAELDPEVVRAVRASLATLDRAIAESRAVLESDPGNDAAQVSLFDALRLKVEVLQATTLLLENPRPPRGALRFVPVSGSRT